MYDNLAAVKKFEPKHRLKRVGAPAFECMAWFFLILASLLLSC